MKKLGELSGDGRLILTDREVDVSYRITVWSDGRLAQANGTIEASGRDIFDAFARDTLTLRLAGGGEVQVIITNADPASGRGAIQVSGPVPGF